MKKTILLTSVFVIGTLSAFALAGKTKSPFSKLGYKKQVMYTSSKGEFDEFHSNADVVEIGSVYFNTKTNEVVGLVDTEKEKEEVASATSAMSVDPLCEKYYWISPYAYCMNNPVKFVDPDGRWVKGSDGKPVSFVDGKWSSNTSHDVIRVGNSMMRTEIGTSHLNEMLSPNSEQISIAISSDIKKDGNTYLTGTTENMAGKDSKGNLIVKESKITIYEGSIEKLTSEGKNQLSGLDVREAIGIVGGHEKGHTEKENIKQSYENKREEKNHDTEARPIEIEKQIINEMNELKDK